MRQFGKILKFELKNYFTNKIFVGVTLFLVAALAVILFFPSIRQVFDQGDTSAPAKDRPVMLVVSKDTNDTALLEQTFRASFPGYKVKMSQDDVGSIKTKITSGKAECAFVMKDLTNYTYYVNNLTMRDQNAEIADSALQNAYQARAMISSGMTAAQTQDVMRTAVTHKTENLGKDQGRNFFYTYVMIFALYMVILLYGQMVATSVATEKSSKAMELLITSAKPVSMMFGKVIASCLAGLTQLIAVFGSALLFFHLSKANWDNNIIVSTLFDMPIDLFFYMLVFFILGFFIYAFLYGAIGSTASKLEDINTSVLPVTLLFIVSFFIVLFSMTSGQVDSVLMKVCSFVPFTSPLAMFTRIAMSTVSRLEIFISIAILILSVYGIGVIAAKIYRVGVLLYGTTPKIRSILKAIFQS